MKVLTVLYCLIPVFLFGCGGDESPTNTPVAMEQPSIGEIHNELLAEVLEEIDPIGYGWAGLESNILEATNRVAKGHGIAPFTLSQVKQYRQMGRGLMATCSHPDEVMATALTEEEMLWWMGFSAKLTPTCLSSVRSLYENHCELVGYPEEETVLAYAMDVFVSSSEFWFPRYYTSQGAKPQSWLQFFVCIAVDATAGGLAAAGGGGPVGGAIVGGLASEGANSLMN